jgi:hypothetical protein
MKPRCRSYAGDGIPRQLFDVDTLSKSSIFSGPSDWREVRGKSLLVLAWGEAIGRGGQRSGRTLKWTDPGTQPRMRPCVAWRKRSKFRDQSLGT